jgi:hypothetical protein
VEEWCGPRAEAEKVLFAHVGKTGGSSSELWLKRKRIAFHRVHKRQLNADDVRAAHVVIVNVRDPYERAVSGFNWRQLGTGRSLASRFEKEVLFRCFADPDEFARALLAESAHSPACRQAAHAALHLRGKDEENRTMCGMGYGWVFEHVIDQLESAPASGNPAGDEVRPLVVALHTDAVRTETVQALAALLAHGVVAPHGKKMPAASEFPQTHTFRYEGSNRTITCAAAQEAMRRELIGDYKMISRIERLHARSLMVLLGMAKVPGVTGRVTSDQSAGIGLARMP